MPRVDVSELDLDETVTTGNRILSHLVGAHAVLLGYVGDRLGLFEALADHGPLTSTELAERTSLNERYVREWANALVSVGYIELGDGRYEMTKELIFQLGDPESPGFTGGAFQLAYGLAGNVPRLLDRFATGAGIPYDEIGEEVAVGVERTWAPTHEHFLPLWIEYLPEGLLARLRRGGAIADAGCGRGRSTATLARLFPASTVTGIDSHGPSIQAARALVAARGLAGNVGFEALSAEHHTADRVYDFVYMFHALHDMPDPIPALAALRRSLTGDGLLLCVESSASDDPLANRGTPAELFSTVSPLFNLPVTMAGSEDGSGSIMTEEVVRALAEKAGFSSHEVLAIDFPPPSLLHRFHVLRP